MAKQSKPSMETPAANVQTAGSGAESRPILIPDSLQANVATEEGNMPVLEPPTGGIAARAAGGGAGAWFNRTAGGLWSIAEDRNAWVYVNSVGWVKLSNASESGLMALNMLAASARQTGGAFNYRQEADNMIHEIYVW